MALNHSHSKTDKHRRAVGTFPDRHITEQALHQLRDTGFPMDRVSVITRDVDDHQPIAGVKVHDVTETKQIGNKADEGATVGAVTGGALGGLTGLLVGLGTLAIPGIGPIILTGATATALATTLAGGAIGAATGGLIGGLVGLGVPEERAKLYNDRVARGEYLVIVDGTDDDIAQTERVLHHRGIEEYGVYDIPGVGTSSTFTMPVTSVPQQHPDGYQGSPTDIERSSHAVAVFSNRRDLEYAIADLRNAGFPLKHLSVFAHQFEQREPFTNIDFHDRFDAAQSNLPPEQSHYYTERSNRGDDLMLVHGTERDIRRAAAIVGTHGVRHWQVYDAAPTHSVPVETVHPVRQDIHPVEFSQPTRTVQVEAPPVPPVPHSTTTTHSTVVTHPVSPSSVVHSATAPIPPAIEMAYPVEDSYPLESSRPLEAPRPLKVTPAVRTHETTHVESIPVVRTHETTHATLPTSQPNVAATPPSVPVTRQAIGIFPNRQAAEAAIAELRHEGLPLQHLTLVARNVDRPERFQGVPLRDRFDAVHYGLSDDYARYYSDRFEQGDYLILVQGVGNELRRVVEILNRHGVQKWQLCNLARRASSSELVDRTPSTPPTHPAGSTLDTGDRTARATEPFTGKPEVVIIDRRHEHQ